jgi:isopentenyl phosphate kinase
MPDVVLVKLGGSLITEKRRREAARPEVIARLAAELARAAGRTPERIVLGHGSGSFGHVAASEARLAEGLRSADQLPGVGHTQERAAALHADIIRALLRAELSPFSIAPSSCVVAAGGRVVDAALEPLRLALERGLLPVVYGDVVMDRERGVAICSTERMFEALAERLPALGIRVTRALWLGETDGVWDAAGRTVPRISAADAADADTAAIGAAEGTDVTGGMLHRVETAIALARLGIPSRIVNGLTPGALERALLGEPVPGTEVA